MLQVQQIEKRYETVRAVDSLSFDVQPGEIFALLGPNGAGKTTTVRMLLGIIRPDRGTVSYTLPGTQGGLLDPGMLGYLPEERGLFKDVSIIRTIVFLASLRGVEPKEARRRGLEWLERLGLKGRENEKVEALSKGNQQKIQFIASVLHRPAFAVLDEPFSGLDPVNQEFFLNLMKELRSQGMTILLSAHHMHLVERLADRILLMSRGRAVLHGTLAEIRRESGLSQRIVLKVQGSPDLSPLEAHPAVAAVEVEPSGAIAVHTRHGHGLSDLLATASRHYQIESIHSQATSLHDIYVRAVGPDAVKSEPTPEPETDGSFEEVSR